MTVKMLSLRKTIARIKREAKSCERKAESAARNGLIETATVWTAHGLAHRKVAAMLSLDLAQLEAEP